tara:strand:+ start:197 stop:499 length:303 start_codon:yes stop_codon:yes gene_type:complete
MAEQPGSRRWYIKEMQNEKEWFEAQLLDGVWKVYKCWGCNTMEIGSVQELSSVQEYIANLTGKEVVMLSLAEQYLIHLHEEEEENARREREEEEDHEAMM